MPDVVKPRADVAPSSPRLDIVGIAAKEIASEFGWPMAQVRRVLGLFDAIVRKTLRLAAGEIDEQRIRYAIQVLAEQIRRE